MAIVKAKQKEYHARVPNETARDKNLSLKAKGLLCVLLSMDEDWKIYKKQISEFSTDKYDATDSAFKELIENGYIVDRGRQRGPKGYLSENLYEVHAEKVRLNEIKPNRDFPDQDNPSQDNPELSNYTINSIENKEKENKEVNLNIINEQGSLFDLKDLNSKGNSQILIDEVGQFEKHKKEMTLRQKTIEFWLKEFHIGWSFSGVDAKKIDSLIKKLTNTLANYKNEKPTDNEILDLFKVFCKKLPDFYKNETLSVLDSKYDSIISKLKENQNGQSNINSREYKDHVRRSVSTILSSVPDPRK